MKKAANALLDELAGSEAGLVKVGIVPFDVNVRVPTTYKTASWFTAELAGQPVLERLHHRPRPAL